MLVKHSTPYFEALDALVQERRTTPFAWGSHDCCSFAADWIVLATGADPMADLRGYEGAVDAGRMLAELGGIEQAVTARLGFPLLGTMAQFGDVVLVRHQGERPSMGVCTGSAIAVPGEAGLLFVPITQAEAAWRVG